MSKIIPISPTSALDSIRDCRKSGRWIHRIDFYADRHEITGVNSIGVNESMSPSRVATLDDCLRISESLVTKATALEVPRIVLRSEPPPEPELKPHGEDLSIFPPELLRGALLTYDEGAWPKHMIPAVMDHLTLMQCRVYGWEAWVKRAGGFGPPCGGIVHGDSPGMEPKEERQLFIRRSNQRMKEFFLGFDWGREKSWDSLLEPYFNLTY